MTVGAAPRKRRVRHRVLLIAVALSGTVLIGVEAYLLSPPVRVGTAAVWESLGASHRLVGMFSDSDVTVRMAASAALVRLGPSAVPACVRGAESPDPQVRTMAFVTLGRVGAPAPDALAVVQKHALDDPAPEVRKAAILVLPAVGDGKPEATTTLVAVLDSGDVEGRLVAVKMLGDPKLPSPDAVAALARALKDPVAQVRQEAAESLAAWGPAAAPALPALIEALRDAQADVRVEAAETLAALAALARPAVPALIAALNDPHPKVRSEAAEALEAITRNWGDAEAALRRQALDELARARRESSP